MTKACQMILMTLTLKQVWTSSSQNMRIYSFSFWREYSELKHIDSLFIAIGEDVIQSFNFISNIFHYIISIHTYDWEDVC